MIEPAKQVSESVNLKNLEMPSFEDRHDYDVIIESFKEGVVKYYRSNVSKKNTDIHKMDEDLCKKVIEKCLMKYWGEKIIEEISTTHRNRIFNKLNNKKIVESEGLLGITEEGFYATCVAQYFKDYIRPKELTKEKTINDGHFILHYSDDLSENALNDIEQELGNYFNEICDFFNLSEEKKKELVTDIYLYDTQELFHFCVFGAKEKKWILAFAGTLHGIHIINPEKIKFYSKNYTYESFIHALPHEFTHVVTCLNDKSLPPWIVEGIALYLVRDEISEEKSLQEALECKPLNEETFKKIICDDFHQFEKVYGYQYSFMFVDYIMNSPEYGEAKMQEILKNPDRSPFEILGISEEEFRGNLVRYIKKYKKKDN